MLRYLMTDGVEIEGKTADDIVAAMNASKMTPVASIERYRELTVQRMSQVFEDDLTDIVTDSASLLDAMTKVGLVERIA